MERENEEINRLGFVFQTWPAAPLRPGGGPPIFGPFFQELSEFSTKMFFYLHNLEPTFWNLDNMKIKNREKLGIISKPAALLTPGGAPHFLGPRNLMIGEKCCFE